MQVELAQILWKIPFERFTRPGCCTWGPEKFLKSEAVFLPTYLPFKAKVVTETSQSTLGSSAVLVELLVSIGSLRGIGRGTDEARDSSTTYKRMNKEAGKRGDPIEGCFSAWFNM